jgi:hypothetical protein
MLVHRDYLCEGKIFFSTDLREKSLKLYLEQVLKSTKSHNPYWLYSVAGGLIDKKYKSPN